MVPTALAASLLLVLPLGTPSALAWIEMSTSQVSGSVVVSVILLARSARFAAGEKLVVGRDIDRNPSLAKNAVCSVDVPTQFVLAFEAFGTLIAARALDSWVSGALIGRFGYHGNVLRWTVCELDSQHFVLGRRVTRCCVSVVWMFRRNRS